MAFFQCRTLWVNHLAAGVAELVLDCPNSERNRINAQLLDDFEEALTRIEAEEQFEVLVLRSAKPTSFCHGFDLEFLSSLDGADAFVALARRGQALCARLAQLPIPSLALLAGSCLGPGLELALACDHRVVLDRPDTQLGLSQRELGLIPAWGGTQRLPRLLGLEKTLPLVLAGRLLGPAEALDLGLVDELIHDDDGPPAFLTEPQKRDSAPFTRRTWRQRLLESTRLGCQFLLRGAERVLRRRLPDDLPGPLEAFAAVRLAVLAPYSDAGFNHECQALGRLGISSAFRHLLAFQRQREHYRATTISPPAEPCRRVALLGAGPASLALLHQAIRHGHQVVLRATDEQQLGVALLLIFKRLETDARRGLLSAVELKERLAAIHGTFTWTHFDTVDLILDLSGDSSARLLCEAAAHAPPAALLACGGPTQSLAAVQQAVSHPARVLGVSFVEPRGPGSLVELAGPASDSQRGLASWLGSLGYTPLTVADCPGRLVLRVLLPALQEAAALVREGMSLARVDGALRRFGFTYGPLEYLDLLGLDVAAEVAQDLTLDNGFTRMLDAGCLGVKAGTGFYQYRVGRRRPNADAQRLLRADATSSLPPLSLADQGRLARERVTGLLLLHAARALEEGIVPDATILDFALCQTIWPPHRGGPIAYARALPAGALAKQLDRLAHDFGPRFETSATALALLAG